MATDLVGNEKLQRFIQLLSELNHETAEAFSTGKTELLHKMNDTILEMYAIQQKGVLHRWLNLLRIINVYGCLEGESLRVDEFLGAMVFEEVEVVR